MQTTPDTKAQRVSSNLPRYSNPPVVETVIGVQFAPLVGYSSVFAGRFWSIHLGQEWAKSTEAPRIMDQFERFDDKALWTPLTFTVQPGLPNRVQFTSANEDRMIQIQDSRFILNWRKKADRAYPTYETLLTEFVALFRKFATFASEAGLGNIEPNGWEVTYVNHIPRGDLWNSVSDFSKIVPGLSAIGASGFNLETMSADWRYTLPNERGRLYTSVRHILADNISEAMMIQLVVRGGIDPEKQQSLKDGLELGHEAAARCFVALTSSAAQACWGKEI